MNAKSSHVAILDPLRGFAALAVCLSHFTCGNPDFLPPDSFFRRVGAFGSMGVDVFFVVSGFILPYAMHQRGHQWKDSGSFLVRRLKRLEPPYFACILLTLGLGFAGSMVPGYRGAPPQADWPMWLAHAGYLNAILGYGWINPVFWTLAIEFQYYIFIALAFGLIAHERAWIRWASVFGVAACGLLGFGNSALLPHWLPLFAVGMAAFLWVSGLASAGGCLLLMAGCGAISMRVLGWEAMGVGLATSLLIVFFKAERTPLWLVPLGKIGVFSYSIYLVHVPVGMRVINLSEHFLPAGWMRYGALLGALLSTVAAAYVFWKVIERPAQSWAGGNSSKIRPA